MCSVTESYRCAGVGSWLQIKGRARVIISRKNASATHPRLGPNHPEHWPFDPAGDGLLQYRICLQLDTPAQSPVRSQASQSDPDRQDQIRTNASSLLAQVRFPPCPSRSSPRHAHGVVSSLEFDTGASTTSTSKAQAQPQETAPGKASTARFQPAQMGEFDPLRN